MTATEWSVLMAVTAMLGLLLLVAYRAVLLNKRTDGRKAEDRPPSTKRPTGSSDDRAVGAATASVSCGGGDGGGGGGGC